MLTTSTSEWTCQSCGKRYATAHWFNKHICKPKPATPPARHPCEFCKLTFSRESSLLNHMCEQKWRYLQRDGKAEKMAFAMYQHFYEHAMARRRQKLPSEQSFRKSDLYGAFIRFARHLINLEAPHPLRFVDFLLHVDLPIDKWTNPEVYARYIRELNKNELPIEAIERNFNLMRQWSVKTGEDWRDFFRLIAPPQATLWIISGRISPWLLFTASSAIDLLQRLNHEQQLMVEKAIDMNYWRAKIIRHQTDVDTIRAMLEEDRI